MSQILPIFRYFLPMSFFFVTFVSLYASQGDDVTTLSTHTMSVPVTSVKSTFSYFVNKLGRVARFLVWFESKWMWDEVADVWD